MPSLSPDQVQRIHEHIHNQQLIHAIKLYREATGASLAEAKQAVEEMARDEFSKPPSNTMDYDNPILEAKIKSMLSKRQKVAAVKIYREEYGVGLKEAKDAVDRIEAGMKRSGSAMNMSYESAIGEDPFAERSSSGRPTLILLVAMISILVCGIGVFILMLNS